MAYLRLLDARNAAHYVDDMSIIIILAYAFASAYALFLYNHLSICCSIVLHCAVLYSTSFFSTVLHFSDSDRSVLYQHYNTHHAALTGRPTVFPTSQPSGQPSSRPSGQPSRAPSTFYSLQISIGIFQVPYTVYRVTVT